MVICHIIIIVAFQLALRGDDDVDAAADDYPRVAV
jgi:hypothetical protein